MLLQPELRGLAGHEPNTTLTKQGIVIGHRWSEDVRDNDDKDKENGKYACIYAAIKHKDAVRIV